MRDLLQQLEPSSPNHLYAASCAAAASAGDATALRMALAAWLGRHGVLQAPRRHGATGVRCTRPGKHTKNDGKSPFFMGNYGKSPFFMGKLIMENHNFLWENYGKSPCLMGKLTISMAMFNSKLINYQRVIWGF